MISHVLVVILGFTDAVNSPSGEGVHLTLSGTGDRHITVNIFIKYIIVCISCVDFTREVNERQIFH